MPSDLAWTALDMIPVLLNGDIFRCKAVSGSDGRLIAFAAAEFNRSAKTAFLLTIAVAAEARRRGLGSLLLRGCERACSEQFAGGRMKLTVSTVNNARSRFIGNMATGGLASFRIITAKAGTHI